MERFYKNPVITRKDLFSAESNLKDVSSIFNPGAVKFRDKYLLLLRVQNRGRESFLVKAMSDDGYSFKLESKPVTLTGLQDLKEEVFHIYDPRITSLENKFYITLAFDFKNGCRTALFTTDNFDELELISFPLSDYGRNGVLFPAKINGMYHMLLRLNQEDLGIIKSGSSISHIVSSNLLNWENKGIILSGRKHYWDEFIGSGPPPIKTEEGWLHIYHGIATHFQANNIYQAGVVLFDLNDPSKIIARCKYNILEPRENYELIGQVPNVVFPSGIIVEKFSNKGFADKNSPVRLYYGAADTCVCVAESTIGELLNCCYDV